MKRLAVAAAVVLALGTFVGWAYFDLPAQTAAAEGEDADAYEALFRHQLRRSAANGWPAGGAFFLSVEGKNPPPELLARFEDEPWPVREGSRYGAGRGVLIAASGLRRIEGGRVVVTCEERIRTRSIRRLWLPGQSSGVSRYTLVRVGGGWSVEKVEGVLAACG
jgi:hypothetical protein